MSGEEPTGADKDGKLRRLPPGRHGLSREFVTRNQRERLAAGTIAAVAEHGYREAGVTQIAAAAGVSRRTFYSYFATKEESFLDTFDLFEEHLFKAVTEADSGVRGWSAKVRARVTVLLDFLSENPDLVSFSISAPLSAGGDIAGRSRRFVTALVERLTDGHPKGRGGPEELKVELEAMEGAISSVLVAGTRSPDGDTLAAAGPQLLELVLAPFLGRRRAAAEAAK